MSTRDPFPEQLRRAFTPKALSRGRSERNAFRAYSAPLASEPMSRSRKQVPEDYSAVCPLDLAHFAVWFEGQEDARNRFRWALRDSLDELLDGRRTGRWAYQHLRRGTEKAHLGTVVEINLTKEFEIPSGEVIDWSIDGEDIDCKFSKDVGGWEIPMEMYRCEAHQDRQGTVDHPALLVWMNEDRSEWAAGLIRITDDVLAMRPDGTRIYNGDNKRKIGPEALASVHWLWGGLQHDLPGNMLLHMDDATRSEILGAKGRGQGRVTMLFRKVQLRPIGRSVVLTLGQQEDAPKRVRDARPTLCKEGVIILGHQQSDPHVARRLGLLTPVKGEWLSVRIAQVDEQSLRPKVYFEDRWWAVAEPEDPIVAVPLVPKALPADPLTGETFEPVKDA